jgi:transposase
MDSILFVGLDVDDKAFHLCGVTKEGEQKFQFSCRPNIGVLATKLAKHVGSEMKPKLCYEATYLGFSLQRDLVKRGFECDIIAPSLVPVVPGERVKTNRLDCEKLAVHLSKNDLTKVHIPSVEEESVRDLIRGRKFLSNQLKRYKQYTLSFCRRQGWNYREEKGGKASYWTAAHFAWLEHLIKSTKLSANKFTLSSAVDQVKHVQVQIKSFEDEIDRLAEDPFYRRKLEALLCIRGIGKVSAMTLITEIGDPNRFSHPGKLASYAGMDICEYSSGKEKRWSITKMGNHHLRTASVESTASKCR